MQNKIFTENDINKDEFNQYEKPSVKEMYRRLGASILSTIVLISMFVVSTYAWFASSATTGGNKIQSGIMAVELVMSKSELESKLQGTDKNIDEFTKYIRQINSEDYYVVTGTDTTLIELKNIEPGQIYPIKIKLVNVGQLAMNYMPYFEIEEETDEEGNIKKDEDGKPILKSYTGLETLEIEKALSEKFLGTDFVSGDYSHDDDLAEKGLLTNRNYEVRKRVLEREQIDKNTNEKIGRHLEDALVVYYGKNESDIKDSNRCGSIKQILSNQEHFNGYLLPISEVEDTISSGGKSVVVKDVNGNVVRELEGVTEYGELDLLIVLPAETDNRYEYASLTLRVGVKGRQVEYEKDGLGIAVYDRNIGLSDAL